MGNSADIIKEEKGAEEEVPVKCAKNGWFVTDKRFYKRMISLTLPLARQNILTYAVGLADNIMVGSIGDLALSGVYMANQWYTLMSHFILGLSNAAGILATQYWGRKDTGSIKTIISITARFLAVLTVLFFIPACFFPGWLLHLYTNDEEVIGEAVKYLRIVSFSYLFYGVAQLLMASMKCVESVKICLYTSMISLVVDVLLNYVLIFGKLGLPAMGVEGAALATLVCRAVEMGVMIYYVSRKDDRLRMKLSDLARYSKVLLKDYLKYGLPIFAGSAMWGVNNTAQSAILGRLGQVGISAISISNNLFNLVSVGMYGVASATAIVIGKTVGSGQYELVKKYAKTLQILFLFVGAATSGIMYLSHFLIPVLYPNSSAETMKIAYQLVLVLTVMCFGTSYQMSSLTGIVRAGGKTYFVFVNDTLFIWLWLLPMGFLSAFVWHLPVWAVYAFLKSDQILKCFVAVVEVNRFKWIKNITRDNA